MGVSKDTSHKTSSSFPEDSDIFLKLNDGDAVNSSYLNKLFSGAERTAASIGVAPITYDGVTFPSGVDTIDEVLREMSRIAWGEIQADELLKQTDSAIVYTTSTYDRYRFYQDYGATVTFPTGRFTKTSTLGANPNTQIFIFIGWQNDVEERDGRQVAEDQPEDIRFRVDESPYGYHSAGYGGFDGAGETPGANQGITFTYSATAPYQVTGFQYWDCRYFQLVRNISSSWLYPAPTDPMYRNSFGEKLVWCAIELPF
jgi:hypothetical protein